MENLSLGLVPSSIFQDSRGVLKVLVEDGALTVKKSTSLPNVFRGLHVQAPPFTQKKYIRVVKGEILDICLNLDRATSEFGMCSYYNLKPSDSFFFVPEYYAHGFLTLCDTEFEYICIGKYSPDAEYAIDISNLVKSRSECARPSELIISAKDLAGYELEEALSYFSSVDWSV